MNISNREMILLEVAIEALMVFIDDEIANRIDIKKKCSKEEFALLHKRINGNNGMYNLKKKCHDKLFEALQMYDDEDVRYIIQEKLK